MLHNNAGGSTLQDGPVTVVSEDEFWRVLRLDLYGTFLCSKVGIPLIAAAGGGSVINMTSMLALNAVSAVGDVIGAREETAGGLKRHRAAGKYASA